MGLLAEWKMIRWLGPWADPEDQPTIQQIDEQITIIAGRTQRMRFFYPKCKPRGCLLLISGLHFKGLDHPRLNRMAAIAASTGLLVGVPELADFKDLTIRPTVIQDARAALERLIGHPQRKHKIGIMAVSFGSLPAVSMACSPELKQHLGGVLTFGGYTNWPEVMRWTLGSDPDGPSDSVNYPVVFKLLSQHWSEIMADGQVDARWNQYIRSTWNIEDLSAEDKRAMAMAMAAPLSGDARQLFLQGCGQAQGWRERAEEAILAARHLHWIDLRPRLEQLQVPLIAAHSSLDGISPTSESERLVAACPPAIRARCHLTGMVGHSGESPTLSGLFLALKELWTLRCIVSDAQWISTRPL